MKYETEHYPQPDTAKRGVRQWPYAAKGFKQLSPKRFQTKTGGVLRKYATYKVVITQLDRANRRLDAKYYDGTIAVVNPGVLKKPGDCTTPSFYDWAVGDTAFLAVQTSTEPNGGEDDSDDDVVPETDCDEFHKDESDSDTDSGIIEEIGAMGETIRKLREENDKLKRSQGKFEQRILQEQEAFERSVLDDNNKVMSKKRKAHEAELNDVRAERDDVLKKYKNLKATLKRVVGGK